MTGVSKKNSILDLNFHLVIIFDLIEMLVEISHRIKKCQNIEGTLFKITKMIATVGITKKVRQVRIYVDRPRQWPNSSFQI